MHRSRSWPVGPARGMLLLVGVLLLSCLPALAAGGSSQVVVSYDFAAPVVLRHLDGTDTVQVKGLPRLGKSGEPVLPYRTGQIVLPPGATVTSVTVTPSAWQTLPGRYQVEPGQEPVRLDKREERSAPPPTPPDPKVYGSSDWFPAQPGVKWSVQHWRGYAVLAIDMVPVRYLPAAGKLQWARQVKVRVDLRAATRTEQAKVLGGSKKPGDAVFLRTRVDNPEALAASAPAVAAGTGLLAATPAYDYVIVTTEALANATGPYRFQDLVSLKESQGLSATIVTTEWIAANYPGTRPDGGSDLQTQIRNFIIDAYSTWGTRFVLLGGDSDFAQVGGESEAPLVPARYLNALGDEVASDLYYSCLDGTFDGNADGVYGQWGDGPDGGEVDLLAEVHVGRACVDSDLELSTLVAKTITYETTQPPRTIYMVGEYLGFGGPADYASDSKDEVRLGTDAHGYTTVGFENSPFAPTYDLATLYDAPGYDWSPQELIDVINGNIHIINHLGHANNTYTMKLGTSDLSALTNTSYFIGYTQGCYSGSFDNRTPGGEGIAEDCITEHLTNDEHGAVAFIANDRYGWGTYDSTDGPSQRFDREFWDAVLGEGMFEIGAANSDSKWDNLGYIESDEYGRYCAYETNLFGDPALRIKVGVSSWGLVGTDQGVYSTSDTMVITVTDTDLNLDPAAQDTALVTVVSSTETSPETVVLTETEVSSSTFVGAITLTPGAAAPDGQLQVSNDDTITVTYLDADNGSGGSNVPRLVSPRVDGIPPTFAGLSLIAPNDGSVLLAWHAASDPTTPICYHVYRSETPGGQDFSTPLGSTTELTYRDSAAVNGTTYYYVVRAADAAGNEETNTVQKRAIPGPLEVIQSWDMETDPGWTAEGQWAYGQPTGNGEQWSVDPTSGYTGLNVYGYNLNGCYSGPMSDPENLTTGPIDCSDLTTVVLSFQRWLGVESSRYDHASIQVSTDGVAWTTVWENPQQNLADNAWTLVSYDISPQAAGQPTVYLRWQMGPIADWCCDFSGWNIDDVRILGKESITSEGVVTLDRTAYQPAATATITVRDIDLNQDPAVPETVPVLVTSTSEPGGETVVCTEVTPDIGKLVGQITLTTGAPAADGQLQVANGDTISVTYVDADDGMGGTNLPRTATARVDNEPPVFAGLSSIEVGNGYLDLHWAPATDDSPPVLYRIYRALTSGGQDFGSPLAVTRGTVYRDRAVTHGQSYYYVVRAADAAGNEDTNTVEVSATAQFLHTLFINGRAGYGYIDINGMQYQVPTSVQLPHGSVLTVDAVPYPQYEFYTWYGDLYGQGNPATITLDRDLSVCACFMPLPFMLNVNGDGNGWAMLNGWTMYLPASVEVYPWDWVWLEAVPENDPLTNSHWVFDHWSGDINTGDNPIWFSMDSDKSLTAHFLEHLFGFSIAAEPTVVESGERVHLTTQYSDNLGHSLEMYRWTALADMAPALQGELTGGVPYDVATQGSYAYVAAGTGLSIYDISTPAAPRQVGTCDVDGDAWGVVVSGNYAYTSSEMGLDVVDVSDPTSPTVVGRGPRIASYQAIALAWPYVYLAGCRGSGATLLAVDVSNPSAPQVVDTLATTIQFHSLTVVGNHLYATSCGDPSFGVFDVSDPANVALVGTCELPGLEPFGVAVSGNYAYVSTELELSVVDVSDPTAPSYVGGGAADGWADDLALYGHYVLAPQTYGGLAVFDISNATAPVKVGACDSVQGGTGLGVAGDYAYVTTIGQLHAVDLSNPAAPSQVAEVTPLSDCLDLEVAGRYCYVGTTNDGLYVVDMEAPGAPAPVGQTDLDTSCARSVAAAGPYVYVGTMAGPESRTAVAAVDVSDPAHPTQVGVWVASGGYCPASVVLSGHYVYVASLCDGVHVLDVADAANPVEVGYLPMEIGCKADMAISGSVLYLRRGQWPTMMIDISNPANPWAIGDLGAGYTCCGSTIAASGDKVCVGDQQMLSVLSMYSPDGVGTLTQLNMPGSIQHVEIVGNKAYVAAATDQDWRLYLVDISDPMNPQIGNDYRSMDGWDPHRANVPFPASVAASEEHLVYGVDGWGLSFFDQSAISAASGGQFLPSPEATNPMYQAFWNYAPQDVDVILQAMAHCDGVPPIDRTASVKVTVRPMVFFNLTPAEAAPGQVTRIPVLLDLRNREADRFAFSVELAPQERGQPFGGPLSFEADPSLPTPGLVEPMGNSIAVGWLNSIGQPRSGLVHLGDVLVPIDYHATPGDSYEVRFISGGASLGGDEIGSHLGDSFTLRVLARFLVGDSYPLLGDSSGDGESDDYGEFGDADLSWGDSIAVFDSWSLPSFYPVSAGSIRFSALDSYPRDTEEWIGGDWRLSWGDVITTFDRWSNPALPRPWRTLGLGEPAPMKAAAAPAAGGPTITIGNVTGKAGSTVKVPVTLVLGASSADRTGFGVSISAEGGTAKVTGFQAGRGLAKPTVRTASGALAAGWLAKAKKAFTGQVVLGEVLVQIPKDAASGTTWRLHLESAGASLGDAELATTAGADGIVQAK